MIIVFTIRFAIFLIEILWIQWDVTFVTFEATWMPILAHCSNVVVLFCHKTDQIFKKFEIIKFECKATTSLKKAKKLPLQTTQQVTFPKSIVPMKLCLHSKIANEKPKAENITVYIFDWLLTAGTAW